MADKEKAKNNIKLPSKDTMNLYMQEGYGGGRGKLLTGAIVVLALLFLVFAVGGRYMHIYNLKQDIEADKTELATYDGVLADYDEVKTEYDRYAKGFMTSDEKALVSRNDFVNVARKSVGSKGEIMSMSIVNNEATVVVRVDKLESVADIRTNLEAYKDVNSVSVYTATDSTTSDSSVVQASLVFSMGEQIEGGDQ